MASSSKEKRIKNKIVYNIPYIFSVTFDKLNASLFNKFTLNTLLITEFLGYIYIGSYMCSYALAEYRFFPGYKYYFPKSHAFANPDHSYLSEDDRGIRDNY